MASWQFELQAPPMGDRAIELWLQHAAGRILFEDVRGYAIDQIKPTLSAEARAAAQKGIDDALYGLMMVLDGVTGALANEAQRVELVVQAKLVNHSPEKLVAQLDLRDGDGMCMGYHDWLEGYYGEDPVAALKPSQGGE